MNFIENYITLKDDKYIVHRKFNDIDYKFGEFNSLSKAIEFRDKIDSEGWPLKKDNPIFTLDGKKPIKYYIKQFMDNEIITLNRNVTEEDPDINQIYKKFKTFIQDENIRIPLKTFKYFFPRTIDKESIKRKQLNGFTRYNISFIETENTLIKINSNQETIKNTNDIETKTTELHGSNQIVPRLDEFFKEKIEIANRETTENDPILNNILEEFNLFLKKYNEIVTLNSLSNYFSKIFLTKKHAMKLVLNGKTHYNISFNKNQDIIPKNFQDNTKNNNKVNDLKKMEIQYEMAINEINNISLIKIEGKCITSNFDYLMEFFKQIKEKIISLKIDIQNDNIFFYIKIVEQNDKKDSLIKIFKYAFD